MEGWEFERIFRRGENNSLQRSFGGQVAEVTGLTSEAPLVFEHTTERYHSLSLWEWTRFFFFLINYLLNIMYHKQICSYKSYKKSVPNLLFYV